MKRSRSHWRRGVDLGCRDAGRVDVRADATGVINFIEVNVLPGLHPEHSDLPILSTLSGLSYQDLIRRIVESATERVGGAAPPNPQVTARAEIRSALRSAVQSGAR
jgi:hypothetical protein